MPGLGGPPEAGPGGEGAAGAGTCGGNGTVGAGTSGVWGALTGALVCLVDPSFCVLSILAFSSLSLTLDLICSTAAFNSLAQVGCLGV